MAVDTAQKRFSMMQLGYWPEVIIFEQDGSVDADDRSHLLHLYGGITLSGPAGITVLDFERGFARGAYRGVARGMN